MEQTLNQLNEQPHITVFKVTAEKNLNYGMMLDTFYKQFNSRTVQKNHMFLVDSTEPMKQCSMEFRDANKINSKDFCKGRSDVQ